MEDQPNNIYPTWVIQVQYLQLLPYMHATYSTIYLVFSFN